MSRSTHLEKRDAMLEFLDRGLVMVHLDPRCEGVQVPEWFKADSTLRLNIAYGFNLPALEVDAEGIYAVLSFGGQNHGCNLPWSSVFALTLPNEGHDGQVWPGSLPQELVDTISAAGAAQPEPQPSAPRLRVVGGDQQANAPEPSEDSGERSAPKEGEVEARREPTKLRLVTD